MIYRTIFWNTTLALTLFGLGFLVRGRHVRSCFGRRRNSHFFLVEKSERPTIAQFPESVQEKYARESQ